MPSSALRLVIAKQKIAVKKIVSFCIKIYLSDWVVSCQLSVVGWSWGFLTSE